LRLERQNTIPTRAERLDAGFGSQLDMRRLRFDYFVGAGDEGRLESIGR
jgi:hypothetical protein